MSHSSWRLKKQNPHYSIKCFNHLAIKHMVSGIECMKMAGSMFKVLQLVAYQSSRLNVTTPVHFQLEHTYQCRVFDHKIVEEFNQAGRLLTKLDRVRPPLDLKEDDYVYLQVIEQVGG